MRIVVIRMGRRSVDFEVEGWNVAAGRVSHRFSGPSDSGRITLDMDGPSAQEVGNLLWRHRTDRLRLVVVSRPGRHRLLLGKAPRAKPPPDFLKVKS